MTPQAIFDTVCDHLAKQKRMAQDNFGGCQYRAPGGLKCAVGALIPDHLYDKGMDDTSTRQDGYVYGGSVSYVADGVRAGIYSKDLRFIVDNVSLLDDLQKVHDAGANWSYRHAMGSELLEVAVKHNLDASKVTPTLDAIFGRME